ncbi:DNA recombination protein RmuC [Candidatus Saccharibacteria bacterium]|nr:DNA recombination protein RmuC [Candidatus Saccharibacteria bacterium]
MDALIIILIVVLLVAVGGILFLLLEERSQRGSRFRGEEILQRLEQHRGELGANLKSLDERLHAVTRDIGGVRDVTTQLREFQESLKASKYRGGVGEAVLTDLLRQVLPKDRWEAQYQLGRDRVDAVVKTSGGLLVPVDSKFPVEDFQVYASAKSEEERDPAWRAFKRNVKQKLDETASYIRPDEGTVPFVLMYVPYEPMFQEVVSDSELWQYALSKRAYFTSPQTFWVTLQFLTFSLKREQFAEQAEELIRMIHSVSKDARDFEGLLGTASNQVANAKNNVDRLVSVFSSLLGKLESLEDLDSKPRK